MSQSAVVCRVVCLFPFISRCLCVYLSLHVCVRGLGNPFMFMVIDPLKVTVRGDGLGLVKANQSTNFVISAPAADISDLDVVITGIHVRPSVRLSVGLSICLNF